MTDFLVDRQDGRYAVRPLTTEARSWLDRTHPDLARSGDTIRLEADDAAELVVSIATHGMSTRSTDPHLTMVLATLTAITRRLLDRLLAGIVPLVEEAAEGEDADGPWKRWLLDVKLSVNPRK